MRPRRQSPSPAANDAARDLFASLAIDYHPSSANQSPGETGNEAAMVESLLRTVVKIAVASLIVGTILAHFGITIDMLAKEFGLSGERIFDLMKQGLAWALPNMLLGSLVILPIWVLAYLLRPPGGQSSE
jgi:hypothetical protein